MTLLRGHFAMTLVVSTDASAHAAEAGPSTRSQGSGLVVSVLGISAEPDAVAAGPSRTCWPSTEPTARASFRGRRAGRLLRRQRHGSHDAARRFAVRADRRGRAPRRRRRRRADRPRSAELAAGLGVEANLAHRHRGLGPAVIELPPLPAGQVLTVVTAPATVLSTPSVEVDPLDPAVAQLAADLLATQRVSPGCVGLAAPQVGVGWRVFSLDVTGHPKARTVHGEYVLVNPVLESATRNEKGREGCMSVPGPHRRRQARDPGGGQRPPAGQRREGGGRDRRVRGPRAPARAGPPRRAAVPRPRGRAERPARAQGVPGAGRVTVLTPLACSSATVPGGLARVA